jgi:hypothetical protein
MAGFTSANILVPEEIIIIINIIATKYPSNESLLKGNLPHNIFTIRIVATQYIGNQSLPAPHLRWD